LLSRIKIPVLIKEATKTATIILLTLYESLSNPTESISQIHNVLINMLIPVVKQATNKTRAKDIFLAFLNS